MSARQGSPLPFQPAVQPSGINNQYTASSKAQTLHSTTDDDWTFTSALPNDPAEITVTSSNVHITFQVTKEPKEDGSVLVNSSISNNTAQSISDLTFQAAVMKVCGLALERVTCHPKYVADD